MNALIIEDNKQVVKDFAFCLQVRYPDAVITSVAEGQKGLKEIASETFDLIMVDASLPDVEVLDLIAKIRELSDAPLIVL